MHDIFTSLNKQGIEYVSNPNKKSEILIKCVSGLHEDTNPSMRFDLDKNIFHCFSCDAKVCNMFGIPFYLI